jgi:hypothetical protein
MPNEGIDSTNAQRRVESERLDNNERKLVLDYIYDESGLIVDPAGLGLTALRDYLCFAALGFYEIKATSQDNARANLVGTYRLWRHSVENPDEFVHGRLDLTESEESGALCVKMIQPMKPKSMMRASTEEFTGYVFRMSNMYVMLLRDIANNDPRVTIFHSFRDEFIGTDKNPKSVYPETRKHVVHLDGFGMGIDGKKVFLSPVYVELVDDKDELSRLNASLDVVSEADTPGAHCQETPANADCREVARSTELTKAKLILNKKHFFHYTIISRSFHSKTAPIEKPVCTENLNPDVVMMKSAEDGV